MVSLAGGVGSTAAGVVGSLLRCRRWRRSWHCGRCTWRSGLTEAYFTLSLLLMAHTPMTFAIAMTGENAFQALAFAAGNAITFETIGQDNPLAATQFTLLTAAVNLPIIYMGELDGKGGMTGGAWWAASWWMRV